MWRKLNLDRNKKNSIPLIVWDTSPKEKKTLHPLSSDKNEDTHRTSGEGGRRGCLPCGPGSELLCKGRGAGENYSSAHHSVPKYKDRIYLILVYERSLYIGT